MTSFVPIRELSLAQPKVRIVGRMVVREASYTVVTSGTEEIHRYVVHLRYAQAVSRSMDALHGWQTLEWQAILNGRIGFSEDKLTV